jgi:alanine racemase
MLTSISRLLGRSYKPLNLIQLSKSALDNNYRYLNSLNKNIKIAPVLKSNAYGHGLILVANELDSFCPPFFCVDSLFEAYELLKIRIKTPILIMGYFDPQSLQTKKLPFSFAVFTRKQIISINKYQPQAKIHVFVDTGMHREGVQINELENYLTFIKSQTKLQIEGLMSHLAQANKPNNIYTIKQIEIFRQAQEIAHKLDIFPKWIHLANSSGLLNSKIYGNSLGNISRTGLAVYGIDPDGKDKKLKPILKYITQIAEVKEINKGDMLGYDFTYKVKRKMKIAILPLGYNDGVDLRFSNIGYVQVNKIYCPIIGRVSMNITTIDVTQINHVYEGQKAEIFSDDIEDKNSIENAAKLAKTIPYDLLIHLSQTTKREFI